MNYLAEMVKFSHARRCGYLFDNRTVKKKDKKMATTKKVIVTGDDINPTLDKAFSAVVGGSLESEMKVWLEGCDLMHRNIVSVRGMKATLEHTFATVGVLPTLTTSSVAYWGKAHALYMAKGGDKQTLKELLRLAREASSANNGKKGKPTFDKAIEGKSFDEIRNATPTQSAQKKKAHHKNGKGAKDVKITDTESLAKTLIKAIEKGGKISDATLDALADAINGLMMEEVAA